VKPSCRTLTSTKATARRFAPNLYSKPFRNQSVSVPVQALGIECAKGAQAHASGRSVTPNIIRPILNRTEPDGLSLEKPYRAPLICEDQKRELEAYPLGAGVSGPSDSHQ